MALLSQKKRISYVIPCYNEAGSVDALFAALHPVLATLEKKYEVEIVFVNDGSTDGTLEKLIAIHHRDSRVHVLNFSRNFGHQWAITAGLDFVRGDAVVIMDADLQDPPAVSLELVREWEEGSDVVYARRRTRQDSAFKKHTAYLFYRLLDHLAEIKIPRDTGDFRLLDRKVIDTIGRFKEKNRFMRGLVAYVGFKQTAVLYDREARFAGKTGYSLGKMLRLAVDGVTSFSTMPLRLIAQIGAMISLVSAAGILYVLYIKLFHPAQIIEGTTTIIISILFMGGVQMIVLGILGTYIGRIYTEVQDRPLYIVSSLYSKRSTGSS